MRGALVAAILLAACSDSSQSSMTSDTTVRIGVIGPVTGTTQLTGLDSKLGVQLAIDEQNAAGGIAGRQLALQAIDDADQPSLAEQAARSLTDAQATTAPPRCPSTATPILGDSGLSAVSSTELARGPGAVLAIVETSGIDPAIARAAAVAIETGTLFFGAASGEASILRDASTGDCARYLFNYRASYVEEAVATLDQFRAAGVAGYTNLISFDQNDSLGDAGYDAMVAGYAAVFGSALPSADAIARFRYTRSDDTSVPAQATLAESYLAQLLSSQTGTVHVGVMMTDTYGAGATFIQALRDWQYDGQQTSLQKDTRLQLAFSHVSHVGANPLAQMLVSMGNVTTSSGVVPYTSGVYISAIVPDYTTDTGALVAAYEQLLAAANKMPSFTSLEAYITARLFLAGLVAHHGPLTPDSVIPDLEAASLPGLTGGFTAGDHQYSHAVWGITIQSDGSFKPAYVWTADGSPAGSFVPSP